MKTILKFFGYLVVSLVMAAGLIAMVLYIMGLGNGNTQGNILTTMPPIVSTTPDRDGNTVISDTQQNGTSSVTVGTPTPYIEPTPTPDPDATPTPTPTPAPTPTPTPVPAATPLGDGSFKTNTGYWLDLEAEWSAESVDNEYANITIVVNLHSYSLYTGDKRNALEITVGEETTAIDVEAIQVHDNVETVTKLGEYTFTVEAPAGKISLIPIQAVWQFGGTYSGRSVANLTVEGNAEISR